MGVKFTDPRLYLMGLCTFTARNTNTGAVEYWSDKVSDFSENITSNEVIIRAGMLNPIATIISAESDIQVTASAADWSLKAEMMQLGGDIAYNAVKPKCKNVTASSSTLTVDITDGTPVAEYGYSTPFCYVQEIGAAAPIESTSEAYTINPSTGVISDFTATNGKQYKVWYFVADAPSKVGTVYGSIQPGIYNVTVQQAVYANATGEANKGTRVGWLYRIYPLYRMSGEAGESGSQTTAGTTNLSGRALTYSEDVISESCEDCGGGGIACYYVYVPDEAASTVQGLALIGGVVSVAKGSTAQTNFVLMMQGGGFATPDPAFMTYTMTTPITGVSVNSYGLITATGSASGDGELTATYDDGENTFTCVVNVTVTNS